LNILPTVNVIFSQKQKQYVGEVDKH